MVVIDTDVLLLAFAFQADKRQPVNTKFLEHVQSAEPALTIYNLMELLGQTSFNASPTHLDNWHSWLISAYRLKVLSPVEMDDPSSTINFRSEFFDRPFAKMRSQRMAFLDALSLDLAERTPGVTSFVTWNARHFKGKTVLLVQTPEDYLAQYAKET